MNLFIALSNILLAVSEFQRIINDIIAGIVVFLFGLAFVYLAKRQMKTINSKFGKNDSRFKILVCDFHQNSDEHDIAGSIVLEINKISSVKAKINAQRNREKLIDQDIFHLGVEKRADIVIWGEYYPTINETVWNYMIISLQIEDDSVIKKQKEYIENCFEKSIRSGRISSELEKVISYCLMLKALFNTDYKEAEILISNTNSKYGKSDTEFISEMFLICGAIYKTINQLEKAYDYYIASYSVHRNARAINGIGYIHELQSGYENALKYYEFGTLIFPDNTNLLVNYGNLLLHVNAVDNFNLIESVFTKAIEISPSDFCAKYNLARLYFFSKINLNETMSILQSLTGYDNIESSRMSNTYALLGLTMEELGEEPNSVVKMYRIALELDQRCFIAHSGIAVYYKGSGDDYSKLKALEHFTEAYHCSNSISALKNLAKCHIDYKNFEAAEDLCSNGLLENKGDLDLIFLLALVYIHTNRSNDAEVLFKLALEINRNEALQLFVVYGIPVQVSLLVDDENTKQL